MVVLNVKGQTRLSKFYVPATEVEKRQTQSQIQQIVLARSGEAPNFFPYGAYSKIVYRRYQQLYFCMCIDEADNELAALESIHLFVTVLHTYFNPVSELDMLYNFHKCYIMLDEVFLAGEVMETSKQIILTELERMDT